MTASSAGTAVTVPHCQDGESDAFNMLALNDCNTDGIKPELQQSASAGFTEGWAFGPDHEVRAVVSQNLLLN